MKKFVLFLMALLPLAGQAKTERITLQGDHSQLVGDLQTPDQMGKKAPIVIICHGFLSNRNMPLLKMIADGLEAKGIASLRIDLNGHGESGGKLEEMTIPNQIEDLRKTIAWVQADGRFGQIALVGHSQGGVVTSMLAGELGKKTVRSLVLLAPAGAIRDNAISGAMFPGGKGDPLDPPQFIPLGGDKRVGREYVTTAFWLPIYETAGNYRGPACIIHGTGDRKVPYTYGLRFHQMWKGSEYHQLDRFDHGFTQNPKQVADIAVAFLSGKKN